MFLLTCYIQVKIKNREKEKEKKKKAKKVESGDRVTGDLARDIAH